MQSYSAALCANYNDLKETNRSTLDSFTTLVFSYLGFRAQTTDNIITTTLDTLARLFNKSTAILSKSLKRLSDLGVITITITATPKGYKRTSIKLRSTESPFFDYEKLNGLRKYTKDDELSLLYSFVAFKISAYDKLNQPTWLKVVDDQVWWRLDIERITEQFLISERTAFRRLDKLLGFGLIEKKKVGLKTYYTINQEKYKKISTDYQEYLCNKKSKCDFVSEFTDTCETSSINNTSSGDHNIYINNNTRDSDVNLDNLDEIGKDLSKRQIAYLMSAVKITMQKMRECAAWEIQNVFGWIKFSILNPCQRKGITKFKHAVNRFIKLLRERKLTMPFGYNKYTEEGRQYWASMLEREQKKPYSSRAVLAKKIAEIAEQVEAENSADETWRDMLEVDSEQIDRTDLCDEERRVLGEMSNKETEETSVQEGAQERDQRLLNEKAVRFANAISEKSANKSANSTILESLWEELYECIRKGADFDEIDAIVGHLAC